MAWYPTLMNNQSEESKGGIYGAEWDGSSSTVWLRTDDAALFAEPIPQMSSSGGWTEGSSPFDEVAPWKDIKRVTDAEAGELVEIPKFYYKMTYANTTNNTGLKIQISPTPQEGFLVSPAHADRGDGKGERDVVYVGRYHCASNYKSISGYTPANNYTRAQFRSNIHNLGSSIWQWDYAMLVTIQMLYLVEFANWNSQTCIGYGCSDNNYIEFSGLTDSMPYHTCTTQSSRTTYSHTQYRYIEDLWGNVFDWCDGIYFNNANIYCIANPTNFSDTSGGTLVGTRVTSSGWTKAVNIPTITGFEYAMYSNSVDNNLGGSTYISDYCYYSSSGVALCVGSYYSQDLYYGLFFLHGYVAASGKSTHIGSRLMKLP